jgi:hypothetical protein
MGLSATFVVLAMLGRGAIAIPRLFPMPKMPVLREREVVRPPVISHPVPDTGEEEIAVAITLALAHLRSQQLCRGSLGESLETGPGPWWTTGQFQQHTLETVVLQGSN